MLPAKTTVKKTKEIPAPAAEPLLPLTVDPEEPVLSQEEPDVIPEEDPFENPPPFEAPEPGEGP